MGQFAGEIRNKHTCFRKRVTALKQTWHPRMLKCDNKVKKSYWKELHMVFSATTYMYCNIYQLTSDSVLKSWSWCLYVAWERGCISKKGYSAHTTKPNPLTTKHTEPGLVIIWLRYFKTKQNMSSTQKRRVELHYHGSVPLTFMSTPKVMEQWTAYYTGMLKLGLEPTVLQCLTGERGVASICQRTSGNFWLTTLTEL